MTSRHLNQSLSNYSQWQQNKLYEGHLVRLKKIHDSLSKKSKKINVRKVNTIRKLKTQPSQVEEKSIQMVIPLVPDNEGKLIQSTLCSKKLSLRERQQLLENYLLGRRIISTQSVFSAKELKRQFRMHKKISENMSKSLRNKTSLASSRVDNFHEFLRETKRDTGVGMGKNTFVFTISKLLLLKGIPDKSSNVAYNLVVSFSKTTLAFKPLEFNELLNHQLSFKFRSPLIKMTNVLFKLSCSRQNTEIPIGTFELNFNDFEEEKEQNHSVKKNITRGMSLVGSIELKGCLRIV